MECGFCAFEPIDPKIHDENYDWDTYNTVFKSIFPKDGDEIDVKPHIVYLDGYRNALEPITTDPRVLCIMHRAERDLPYDPKEAQIKAFCEHIPTWDEATAYLKKIGAKTDCVPV